MSAKVEQPKSRSWIWPVLFVAALGFVLFISGLQTPTGPGGVPLIKSPDEYTTVLDQANKIFAQEIQKVDTGQALTPDDYKALKQDALLYDELYVFNPVKTGPVFAAGRVHLILNENQVAAEKFQQAIFNSQQPTNDPPAALKQIRADSEWYLATCLENQNDFAKAYPEADQAVKAFPERPDYRVVRARALIQLNKLADAEKDLEIAAASKAANPKVQEQATMLLHFLNSAPK